MQNANVSGPSKLGRHLGAGRRREIEEQRLQDAFSNFCKLCLTHLNISLTCLKVKTCIQRVYLLKFLGGQGLPLC